MKFDDAVSALKLQVGEREARACRTLERRGLRFLVDFGYQNAIEKLDCRKSWTWR